MVTSTAESVEGLLAKAIETVDKSDIGMAKLVRIVDQGTYRSPLDNGLSVRLACNVAA